jgi:hypothetical protein
MPYKIGQILRLDFNDDNNIIIVGDVQIIKVSKINKSYKYEFIVKKIFIDVEKYIHCEIPAFIFVDNTSRWNLVNTKLSKVRKIFVFT